MDYVADAQLTTFIQTLRDNPAPPARTVGADALRSGQRHRVAAQRRGPRLHAVSDERIGDVAVRIYRPTAEHQGIIVYAHGGMWAIGDLESHDRACRRLAHATGATVMAVDYRRAPEHPWPAAVEDVLTAVRHAIANGGRVFVMGDSAGGNLATLACLRRHRVPQLEQLGQACTAAFEQHPDYQIITSFPGLGDIAGARVFAELGDDHHRVADARAVKAYAGSAPVTRASGRTISITHRRIKNDRLAAAGWIWAFAANAHSPAAKQHYRRRRDIHGDRHAAALRHCSTASSAACSTACKPARPTTNRKHSQHFRQPLLDFLTTSEVCHVWSTGSSPIRFHICPIFYGLEPDDLLGSGWLRGLSGPPSPALAVCRPLHGASMASKRLRSASSAP